MNIQSTYGVAFQGTSKIGTPSVGAIAPTPAVDRNTSAPSGASSDKVTISSAAKALAARETDGAYSPGQTKFLASVANGSDAEADKIAYDMAYISSAITYDISHGDIRLASNGRLVEEGYADNFNKLAVAVDAQQRALYESEKAKGTSPKDIVAKLVDFRNAQSDGYREATGWGYF